MAKEQSVLTGKSAKESYEVLITVIPEQGFGIVRRRDIAFLLQASKEIEGKKRIYNVSCKPGKETKITIACLADENDDITAANAAAKQLLDALAAKLSD